MILKSYYKYNMRVDKYPWLQAMKNPLDGGIEGVRWRRNAGAAGTPEEPVARRISRAGR